MDILVPADVEQVVYDYLKARFENVGPVPQGELDGSSKLPFVGYEITGGSRRNMVTDSVLVMIRCYSAKRTEASDICRKAYAVLMAAQYDSESPVRKTKSVGHPVFYPDGKSKNPRYQASVQWQLRPELL